MPFTEPSVLVPVVVAAALYLRGWGTLSRRMPERFGPRQAIAFLAGLGIVLLASSALFDVLGHQFLWAHMIQHLLLMVVAPPLLWMGAPVAPILLGLPRTVRGAVARGLAWRPIRWLSGLLTHPAVSWIAFVVAFWGWHVPALYELALESDAWHHVEHLCFLGAALLFWRSVILPWPARSPWPRWTMIPYLVLADLQNSVLAAIFTFGDRVIYPAYATIGRTGEGSALEDQALAGVIMWVPGSVLFFVPVLWLVVTTLLPPRRSEHRALGASVNGSGGVTGRADA
jgi:cytochrome c oxidase assembly factor CtaG